MAKLAVVQEQAGRAGQARPGRAAAADHRGDHAAQGRDAPLVIDGPFAETKEQLLGFYVVDCADLDEALEIARELGRGQSRAGAYEIRPVAAASDRAGDAAQEAERMTDLGLDRCGADRGAAPGGRRAAALFPRPRHRRGGLPGSLPAGAEDLADERPAARSRRLADLRRAQRRASTRCAGAAARPSRCRPRTLISDLDDAETPTGRAARRRALPRRHPAAAVHLLPSGPAGRRSRSRWRCASSPACRSSRSPAPSWSARAAMEQRITRAKAPHRRGRRALRDAGRRSSGPSGSPPSRP